MEFLKIVFLCIVAAILYGIVHDQITARICVEYFTIGHPRIVETEDPTLLALIWGVLATWWGGSFLGVCIACAARLGGGPPRSARSLVTPVLLLLGLMAAGAIIAGSIGYIGAVKGMFRLPGHLAVDVPRDKHVGFIVDGFAHNASYFVSFIGGLILAARILLRRRKSAATGSVQAERRFGL